MKRWSLFLLFLFIGTLLRFYFTGSKFSFLWFLILYLPMINWFTYWLFCAFRQGVNRLLRKEIISEKGIRRNFVHYLYFPGAMALSEIVYRLMIGNA